MATMVETVARALCINHGADPDQEGPGRRHAIEVDGVTTIVTDHMGPLWMLYRSDALAALKAMEEPTEAMHMAGIKAYLGVECKCRPVALREAFPAMIRAALEEAGE